MDQLRVERSRSEQRFSPQDRVTPIDCQSKKYNNGRQAGACIPAREVRGGGKYREHVLNNQTYDQRKHSESPKHQQNAQPNDAQKRERRDRVLAAWIRTGADEHQDNRGDPVALQQEAQQEKEEKNGQRPNHENKHIQQDQTYGGAKPQKNRSPPPPTPRPAALPEAQQKHSHTLYPHNHPP